MSRTLNYIREMDVLVGEIASYYGEKFAVIIYVPDDGSENTETMAITESGDENNPALVPVNISLERLVGYHTGIWKSDIGIGSGVEETGEGVGYHCYINEENFLSDNLTRLFSYTTNAVASQVVLNKDDVERGQILKTEALGEIYDLNGMKEALARVREILEADYDFPSKGNSESVEEIISLLDKVRMYIHEVVSRVRFMTSLLSQLDSHHSQAGKIYGELVLFSDGGDIVTRKYNTTPKSKTALQEYNPALSKTMDDIEGVVPGIIEGQQESLDMWNLVDSLDKNEIQANKYLQKSYNQLIELKQSVSEQYLSHEIENMGERISNILSNLSYSISDTKSNDTFDKLVKIQQYLQYAAVGGLLPINIITAVATDGWKGQFSAGYPELVDRIESQLEIIKQA